MKNKWVAVLLAFFLGAFGAHWFYLGNNKRGFITLLLTFIFIGIILAFIDFIVLLIMDEKEFDNKYNNGMQSSFLTAAPSKAEEIARLHALLQQGAITEQEFQIAKSKHL